jgi:hypothetical protein
MNHSKPLSRRNRLVAVALVLLAAIIIIAIYWLEPETCDEAARDRLVNLTEPATVEEQLAAAERADRACRQIEDTP